MSKTKEIKRCNKNNISNYIYLFRAGKVGGIHRLDAYDSNSEPFMAWH